MEENRVILCASSKYEEKYYLNPAFDGLPDGIKDELQAMCVLFTEDIGGILTLEYVEDAIADAKINSANNGIANTEFYAGDMKDVLTDSFIEAHGRPDTMIVDPPRAGMHEDVVNVILNASPRRIVYVSCNPATQARDLALLDCKYKVEAIQPVDMFPHTHHVENVVKLSLRE